MPARYQFYTKPEYFEDLIDRISKAKAGDRVAMGSMRLDVLDPLVNEVIQAMTLASARGANVNLTIDAYTFLASRETLWPGPLFWRRQLHGHVPLRYRQTLDALEKFKKAGGHYSITNRPTRPFTRPFVGRSHLKYVVINDRLYLGGCNLDDSDYIDFMVGWDDKVAADWLYRLAAKIGTAGSVRQALNDKDLSYKLPSGSRILLDCGVPNQSLIYEEALRLIDEARESIFIACQYHPNGTTLKHLAAAVKRGVNVSVSYNNAFRHGAITGGVHQSVELRDRLRAPAVLFEGRLALSEHFLHAKLIATEQSAIIGSHNFIAAGVKFGTAEIALLVNEPDFAKTAINTLSKQYNTARSLR